MNKKEILDLVLSVAEDLNRSLEHKIPLQLKEKAKLYGSDGVLDSLAFVTFISAVEQAVQDRFGKSIVLADEKAFSEARSPFGSVGTLTEYIHQLIRQKS